MVQYVEAFEACEYGAPLTCEDIPRLFPCCGVSGRKSFILAGCLCHDQWLHQRRVLYSAKVSVYDHGFLYGDGIFEGLRQLPV